MVNKWLHDTKAAYPWVKAVPGGTCLEVGILRLIRGEVASVVQAYQGLRYFVSEDQLSQGILPSIRILAGCPFATMIARVTTSLGSPTSIRGSTI